MGLSFAPAHAAHVLGKLELEHANRQLHGTLVDYTHNHGADRRLWSWALCERRDLYVYLPPCYDCRQVYPLMVWLHGFAQDEESFLRDVAPRIDEAIHAGRLPSMIVVAPDGSLNGESSYFSAGSFFVNSRAGNFEDYVIHDVLGFVTSHYPIRPEREAHVLAGVSMGGGAAFNLGMKYRACFKVVVGIFPAVNTRWMDCRGRYMGNFNPDCWGWRTDFTRRREVVARFGGVLTYRLGRVLDPLYDRLSPTTLENVSRENPIEMLDRLGLQNGELDMYIGYGGKDQFNVDAQVESFLYVARERGICIHVDYLPHGRHNVRTAVRLFPGVVDWLGPLLAPYGPVKWRED